MQFLFVDKITEMGSDEIKGELCIANGPYTRTDIEGSFVSSGYISEAIGQLASWLAIAKSDFTKKPVFLFCPEISYGIPAPTSKVIQIYSRIDRMEDDSMIFSGEASVNGQTIASLKQCNCHLMPLDKLEDPAAIKARFNDLMTGQWNRLSGSGLESIDYDLTSLKSDDPSQKSWSVALKNIDFVYADHFPRYPVTPIVVLNEVVQKIIASEFSISRIDRIKSLKIRNFILPNEKLELNIKQFDERKGHPLSFQVDLKKDQKHVMRGVYEIID